MLRLISTEQRGEGLAPTGGVVAELGELFLEGEADVCESCAGSDGFADGFCDGVEGAVEG